jgi:hypothetical protein
VWGEFEVDCANGNDVSGLRPLVEQLTRAYVRAAPGRLNAAVYDPSTGRFNADGTDAVRDQELVVFYPSTQHIIANIDGSGLEVVEIQPAPGGNSYLVARVTGGNWSIEVTPAP